MEISGISALRDVLKRPVGPRNDALAQRRELSAELQASCQKLVMLLKDACYKISPQISEEDLKTSGKKIMDLKNDFQQVDGPFLEDESPVLQYLSIDMRFKDFAQSCAVFYRSALILKSIFNEKLPDLAAVEALCKTQDPSKVTSALQGDLEKMLTLVNQEYMKVMVLKFSW